MLNRLKCGIIKPKRSPPSPKKIALLVDTFERNLLRHIENLISAASGGDPPPSTPIGLYF
ncbi:hypothetical protein QJS10_CPB21g00786 [Acorus calamus]|uniref:Uncharacterized protein n=1 Tax=Acorus calamus TaxID=4465 RepID=A0AAV9C860_ACOCL|nr:hypothetical protein QJS10_CPB21g00786 [Acorus calamus]